MYQKKFSCFACSFLAMSYIWSGNRMGHLVLPIDKVYNTTQYGM